MKGFNKILYVVILSCLFFACMQDAQTKSESLKTKKLLTENLKNVEVQIKGMTCEIGCARLIQSKLYKTDGVKFANVSFTDSLGEITFDANKVSEVELKTAIERIAGGDLYRVEGINEVESFKEKQENKSVVKNK